MALETKKKMSAVQLSIVVASTGIGSQLILATRKAIEDGGHLTWLSIILGGLIFYGAAVLMVKLGQQYPENTLVDYMPRIWGTYIGECVIWWFILLFLLQFCTITTGVGKTIIFFMFDRTPAEVIILSLLAVCVYCALQDWGSFLRIQQFLFFTTVPLFTSIWLISLLNFRLDNLLPLWSKQDLPGMIKCTFLDTWNMYNGYEVILFLLPFMARGKQSVNKPLQWSFGCMGLLLLSIIVIVIGVLTVKGAKNAIYPTMTVISSVEVPGTFIERLDTYLVVSWIPVVFDTLAIFLWIPAKVLMQRYHYLDHRPILLALTPIIYTVCVLLENMKFSESMGKLVTWLGVIFSLVVIPLSLMLIWWKKRGETSCES